MKRPWCINRKVASIGIANRSACVDTQKPAPNDIDNWKKYMKNMNIRNKWYVIFDWLSKLMICIPLINDRCSNYPGAGVCPYMYLLGEELSPSGAGESQLRCDPWQICESAVLATQEPISGTRCRSWWTESCWIIEQRWGTENREKKQKQRSCHFFCSSWFKPNRCI